MEKNEKLPSTDDLKTADLKQKWGAVLHSEETIKYWDQAADFAAGLRKKYGNETDDCLLYHILAGSSMVKKATMFDFEGEDSIEQFILKCYNELLAS